jgi:hypothetical protein
VTDNNELATLTVSNILSSSAIFGYSIFINVNTEVTDDNTSGMFVVRPGSEKVIILHKGDIVTISSSGSGLYIDSTSGISNLQQYNQYISTFVISESVATVSAFPGVSSGGSND